MKEKEYEEQEESEERRLRSEEFEEMSVRCMPPLGELGEALGPPPPPGELLEALHPPIPLRTEEEYYMSEKEFYTPAHGPQARGSDWNSNDRCSYHRLAVVADAGACGGKVETTCGILSYGPILCGTPLSGIDTARLEELIVTLLSSAGRDNTVCGTVEANVDCVTTATAVWDAGCCTSPAAGLAAHTHLSSKPVKHTLSARAAELLKQLPKSQFKLRPADARNKRWEPRTPGVLDLYAGSNRFSKKILRLGAPWVLTFDKKHNEWAEDLLKPEVQALISELAAEGAFLGIGAGPPCSSFSTAVCPPVRSAAHPRGVPGLPAAWQKKLNEGNLHSNFVLKLLRLCGSNVYYWVENPHGSWLWRQRGWQRWLGRTDVWQFVGDHCRFGTAWRKRTRLATNIASLGRLRLLCNCSCGHTTLRGRGPGGVPYTQLAEPFPHAFALLLAEHTASACGRAASHLLEGADVLAATSRLPLSQ